MLTWQQMSKYYQHIAKLAKELNCCLVIDVKFRTSAMMYVENGYVEVPPIENQIDYLINLHELGHVAHGHTQGRPPHEDKKFYFDNGVLRSEAQAWEWALDQCIDKTIEASSRVFMWDTCLGTYYDGAIAAIAMNKSDNRLLNGNRHHVAFAFDKPDEYFTSIVKRIQGDLTNYSIDYKG
jgi:hypothetical protein